MEERVLTEGDDVYVDQSSAFHGAVYGRAGKDEMHGSYEAGLYGEDGDDTIYGGMANTLDGGAGVDVLFQGQAICLHGGDGNDVLNGSICAGVLYGDAGDDTLLGGGTEDLRPSAISLGSGQLTQTINGGNVSRAAAIDLSARFSLADDPNIGDATSIPHVTVTGVGAGATDLYRVTINNPGASILIDVDQAGLANPVGDTVIALLDSGGYELAFDDDCTAAAGAGGSTDARDSYLNYSSAAPGTYYIQIRSSEGALAVGEQYQLQLSISDELGDVLDGGTGADRMEGSVGNQIYYVDNAGDKVIEAKVSGFDTVFSSVSYSLKGQYVEALTLTGSADLNATGNTLDNVLTGNAGLNVLTGGKGDDDFYVQNAGDRAVELDGQGNDRVLSPVSYSLASQYVERLRLTGSADADATGNSLKNSIAGNSGDNILDGGKAADRIAGGAGHDTFVFKNALGPSNVDVITDFKAVDDTFRLDDAAFKGLAMGALSPDAFFAGTAAHNADDRVIYNATSGALLFDRDGSGSTYAAVQFATLENHATITAADFIVI